MLNWKFWKKEIIEFYCHPSFEGVIPEPKPAVKFLPDWFKNLDPIYDGPRDPFGNLPMSAKKCLPLLDGMSLGFVIPLSGDLHVQTNHDCSQFKLTNPANFTVSEFHDENQVGGHSAIKENHGSPLKFINHWIIKTAPGWSTLFIPPMNHLDQPFTCLSALVDTDVYPKEVNFPAIWHIPDADIHLRAGTPLVVAIPIKRKTFNNRKTPIRKMTESEIKQVTKIQKIQNIRSHHYTWDLRIKK